MYFNKKGDTNIDNEFPKQNIFSNLLKDRKKLFIGVGIIILFILGIVLFVCREPTNYLELLGDNKVTIYLGADYIEPGYKAYNSRDEDLFGEVLIDSNVNNNVIGEYEITYTLGELSYTRVVNVVEKPKDITYIYLNSVNDNVNVYLKKDDKYIEPGYQAFSTAGLDLTNQVTVTGEVDSSKKGTYKLVYSVVDAGGVTVSVSRMVIIMDSEVSLTLESNKYTNKSVTINASVIDEYFDYMILPDGTKETKSVSSYVVNTNGKYTFTVYNKKGSVKESSIEVKNIDTVAPSVSCTIDQYENSSMITVKATDASGIGKYVYNGKDYSSNKINVSETLTGASVTAYDGAGNNKTAKCTIVPKVYISNISSDGVIVKINAKKVNKEISGYYFSYTNQRPTKDEGYLATSNETIDVVRLPGTTYVWVEDRSGKISEAKTITLSNDVLLDTSRYNKLTNKSLDAYLKEKGWSLEELNKLIARSVRAAGLYTKVGAATAAVSLQTVLAQKYSIKLPYWWGGKSWDLGADAKWGSYRYKYSDVFDREYLYYGMDCTGFTTWAYVNAGYRVGEDGTNKYPAYAWGWLYKSYQYKEENGEIGDFIASSAHVKIIVGKTEKGFIVAEAANGMMITVQSYSKPDGYVIEKGELLMETYGKMDRESYPSGF